MTSRLGSEAHRYDMDEESGAIQDKVGSAHATTTTVTSYNAGEGGFVGMDGVNDQIIFPDGVFDATADVTGYIAFKYKDSVSANKYFWTMTPNSFSPILGWLGSSRDEWVWDVNGGSGTDDASASSTDPTATEIIVCAFSYDLSTRLMSLAVESSEGRSLTATETENETLPTDRAVRIGANGAGSDFTTMDVYQVGMFTAEYSVGDLTDTAVALLAEIAAASAGANNKIIDPILSKIIDPAIDGILS